MSKPFIPKNRALSYARWTPDLFEEKRAIEEPSDLLKEQENQLLVLREVAREDGFAQGFAQGLSTGLSEGRDAANGERERLQQLCENFSKAITKIDESISQELLDLALDLAQAMLKVALPARPELLLPIVKEAVHYLPSIRPPAQLFLNLEDIQLVQEHLGNELSIAGWNILEDKSIERGGCRIETASNQIDATLTSRWNRLVSALSKECEWLK